MAIHQTQDLPPNVDRIFGGARWIGRRVCLNNWQAPVLPAPLLRRSFEIHGSARSAQVAICGLGFYEMSVNGRRVGDQVLDPIVTQFDKTVHYVVHDLAEYLHEGENVIGVMLGNGWYNCHTPDVWHFDKAPWRDYPKLLLRLVIDLDGQTHVIESDTQWKVADGPIRFDGLRNGEVYDARHERPGWDRPGYNDVGWDVAHAVAPPGGVLTPQIAPACQVVQTLEPIARHELRPGTVVLDLGQNIAGWAQLQMSGSAGDEVTLRYGERLNPDGTVNQEHISKFILSGECQVDRYVLKGGETEQWEPCFTYHGFQYVQAEAPIETARSIQIKGRVVQSAFETIGSFECSDPIVNRLHTCTLWSYRGNFVGIPTDCPHREKNGWTGDAQLAVETGLTCFNAATAYESWLNTLVDTQRPSGQLPGIAPSVGWGFNWGNGPAWDSALLIIPWQIYLFTGRREAIDQLYPAMHRYVDYCISMAHRHIVEFGLGDWCAPDRDRMCPAALTSTGFHYQNLRLLARFAELTGHASDIGLLRREIEATWLAFHDAFYKGDGVYADGQSTALAAALHFDLSPPAAKAAVVARLAQTVRDNDARPDFGILGAKFVPRVLAEHGHLDLAYTLLTQEAFPGWVHWLRQGATTLWESWSGDASRNHIMFGDVSAWLVQYLAGIRPDEKEPGFSYVRIRPGIVQSLAWVHATHRSPAGCIRSAWRRSGRTITIEVDIPEGVTGELLLPSGVIPADGSHQRMYGLSSGTSQVECRVVREEEHRLQDEHDRHRAVG